MHVALGVFMIFALFKWGDYKNWQKYHSTMLYFVMGNLLYNFLTASYFLWRLDADFISNHTLTELIYSFIVFPITALLFLSNYPEKKKLYYMSKWVFIYVAVEYLFTLTKHIEYQYGWTLGWSAFFDVFMFPMLLLHYKKPLLAYAISIPIGVFFIWYFNVPVHIPVEER